MDGYVVEGVGAAREAMRTDYVAPGVDPDAEHDRWRDPEDEVPTDWEGHERG